MEGRRRAHGRDVASGGSGGPKLHGLELLETPVGFKFIGEYIKDGRIFLGGEESAGLSIRGHVPEKDGILACLLLAEMVASRRKSLKTQLKELFSRVGAVYNRRLNVRLDPSIQGRLKAKLAAEIQEFHGRKVAEVNRNGWLEADLRRWKLGIDEAVGYGTGGEVLRRVDDAGRSGNAARIRKAMGQRKIMQGLVPRIAIGVFGLLTVAMILLAIFDERGALALGKRREELQRPQHGHREDHREEQGAPNRYFQSPSGSRCNRTPCARATEARQAWRDCHRNSRSPQRRHQRISPAIRSKFPARFAVILSLQSPQNSLKTLLLALVTSTETRRVHCFPFKLQNVLRRLYSSLCTLHSFRGNFFVATVQFVCCSEFPSDECFAQPLTIRDSARIVKGLIVAGWSSGSSLGS